MQAARNFGLGYLYESPCGCNKPNVQQFLPYGRQNLPFLLRLTGTYFVIASIQLWSPTCIRT